MRKYYYNESEDLLLVIYRESYDKRIQAYEEFKEISEPSAELLVGQEVWDQIDPDGIWNDIEYQGQMVKVIKLLPEWLSE